MSEGATTTFELERDAIAPFAPSNCSAPLRLAYADPPYLGQGKKHYAPHHENASDCDALEWHAALIKRLSDEYPDGWALSLHTPSLRELLPLCPADVRVAAWCKSFCSFKPNVNPAYRLGTCNLARWAQAATMGRQGARLRRHPDNSQARLSRCETRPLHAMGARTPERRKDRHDRRLVSWQWCVQPRCGGVENRPHTLGAERYG